MNKEHSLNFFLLPQEILEVYSIVFACIIKVCSTGWQPICNSLQPSKPIFDGIDEFHRRCTAP